MRDTMRDLLSKLDALVTESDHSQEGEMVRNSLHTIIRVATHLEREIDNDANFPEWVIEKIGAIKSMMVSVMDYAISDQEIDGTMGETALNPNNPVDDYNAKKKALLDLQMDPIVGNDPELSKAVMQRKADLEKEAKLKGVGAAHKSPSGKMTNMNPADDDYEINYGKGAAK